MNHSPEVSALFAAMDSAITVALAAKATYRQSKTRANKVAWEAADAAADAAAIAHDMARNPPGSFLCFHCNKPAITLAGTCGSQHCK